MESEREGEIKRLEEIIAIDAMLCSDLPETSILKNVGSTTSFSDETDFQWSEKDLLFDASIPFDQKDVFIESALLTEDPFETQFDLSDISNEIAALNETSLVTFNVSDNSNKDLIQLSIEDNLLSIRSLGEEGGTADVMIQGIFLNGKVYNMPFRVHVDPVDEGKLYRESSDSSINPWYPDGYDSLEEWKDESIKNFDKVPSKLEDVNDSVVNRDSRGEFVKEYKGFFGFSSAEESDFKESKGLYE